MMMRTLTRPLALCLIPALSACVVPPPPTQEQILDQAVPPQGQPPAAFTAPHDGGSVATGWVSAFRDRRLNALVTEALANNTDLKLAASQVALAQAGLALAGAPLFPAINADGSALGRRELSRDNPDTASGAAIGLDWELDFWGRIRSSQAGAAARLRATENDLVAARLSIAGLVAKSWFTLIALNQSADLARKQVDIYRAQLGLVEDKFNAGQVDQVDPALANASLAGAEALVAEAEGKIQATARALEVLLGRYPANEIRAAGSFPSLPSRVPAGVPANLLNRRPDVLASQAQVDAAFFDVKAAELALLPGFTLTGAAGTANVQLLEVIDLAPDVLGIGLTVLQPIFNGGALKAGIAGANARQQGAIAAYGTTVLNAFRQVETSLGNEVYYRKRLGLIQQQAKNYQDAVALGVDKYNAGTISLQNLLQLQNDLLASDQAVIDATSGLLINRVDLYLALGGTP